MRLLPVFALAVFAAACVPSPAAPAYSDDTTVFAVGDSIMVAANDHLTDIVDGIAIDAEVGRPFRDGLPALERYLAANPTPDVLVVALGTNAGASSSQIDDVMIAADGIERVLFVNVRVPRDWESPTNQAIADAAARYDNVEVVDWYAASNSNDALFRDDGYHPNATGSELWANLIGIAIKS